MRLSFTFASLLLLASPLLAAEDTAKADFDTEIKPLLKAHCYACHGPDGDDGGLRWDSKPSAFRGGDSGLPAVTPHKVAESELIRRLTTDDDSERMPPDGEGEPLDAEQVALLQRWIEQGAPWPAEKVERRKHWAYVAPARPELPAIKQADWPRNEIDHFILSKLEDTGLAPNPAADRARLLRRVSLDLIGLPPTPDEVSAFVADKSPDAYERAVDRLLASPRYGERWAQRWLDLARYADSNGFQRDGFRTVWAYRDYVINSFNDDKPFDQFTLEQLAGDLLPQPTSAQLVATGFHRGATVNVEAGVNQEENRVNQVMDRVNVTGTVFLGTTLECAQCHNHKYDPITQREYYEMYAYFNNTPIETKFRNNDAASLDFVEAPAISVPLPGEQAHERETLQTEYEQLKAEWQQEREAARKLFTAWDAEQSTQLAGDAWKLIEVKDFAAVEQVQHELLADGSVLLSGPNPDRNTFTVTAEVAVDRIAAIKLEALTHKSLPGNGPGRKSDTNPNFVLTHFTVAARDDDAERELVMHEAQADYFAANFHPARSLDANDQNGWAIHSEFGKPHWATFLVKEPLATEGKTTLTFRLVQNYGERRTLGRFRLWVNESTAASAKHPPHVVEVLRIPADLRTEAQRNGLLEYYLQTKSDLQEMQDRMAKMEEKLEALPGAVTLVMRELDSPRMTNLLRRGSFENRGIEVTPGVLEALHPLPNDAPANRLGLAQWITADDNPLFARVTVNRWWAALFGDGLVATEEDFGTQGDRPTHPELLDWLAVEFREHGYSMKHIHRKLVTSATYRQSAAHREELRERDPLNKLYARGPRMRLPAEIIRDNALAVSGLLHHELGGPPVKPPQPAKIWRVTGRVDNSYKVSEGTDRYRRGVYVIWRRSAPYPSFVNFDAPDRSSCVVERAQTNTPLQALTLLNDEVYVEAAMALADRLLVDLPDANPQQRVDYALRLAVARPPRPAETAHLVALYEDELKRHQAEPNKARQLVSTAPLPASIRAKQLPNEELAAWFYVTSVILNLDETISK